MWREQVRFPRVKRQDIKAFVKQVVTQFHPQRVILFGSYAYGNPTVRKRRPILRPPAVNSE